MLTPLQRLQKQAVLEAVNDELRTLCRRPRLTNFIRRRALERYQACLELELGYYTLTKAAVTALREN